MLPFYGLTLPDLNNYLSDKTYLNNDAHPTQIDKDIFNKVFNEYNSQSKSPGTQSPNIPSVIPSLPHLFRWLKHIASFSPEERMLFTQNSPYSNLESKEPPQHCNSNDSIAQLDTMVCPGLSISPF